jgi:hypothetical protein
MTVSFYSANKREQMPTEDDLRVSCWDWFVSKRKIGAGGATSTQKTGTDFA